MGTGWLLGKAGSSATSFDSDFLGELLFGAHETNIFNLDSGWELV
jgi:hypothetical protein